jgi:gliding motility-associated-like protein
MFKDSSISYTTIQNFYWDFGDGTTSTLQNPPPHYYPLPGNYVVTHSITAKDNCTSAPLSKAITVLSAPTLSLNVFDTCKDISPRMVVNSSITNNEINKWQWKLDGADFSTDSTPDFSQLLTGNHSIALMLTSNYECNTNTSSSNFIINPVPEITFSANDGCTNMPILFTAQQTDNLTTINKWLWNFADGDSSNQKNTQHVFTVEGNHNVQLNAEDINGCVGEFSGNVLANAAHANAGKDTVVLTNTSFQLQGSGGTQYVWSPSTGLNDAYISNPIGNLSNDMTYMLSVKTTEGCTGTASVKVIVVKNTAVFVPTAFTPNNDGLNDIIKPYLVGIKTLEYFTIYNRWGQKVFSTNQMGQGWDGHLNGKIIDNSEYAWFLRAEDIAGKVYNLKGTFILIK